MEAQEDPEILRMALDQCRKDLSRAHEQINSYRLDYDRVVPQTRFDNLERQFAHLGAENDDLLRENKHLRFVDHKKLDKD